jgi:hypothetical protein
MPVWPPGIETGPALRRKTSRVTIGIKDKRKGMCRSIKVLRRPEAAATPDELHGAALQFVRKISGYHKPSKANQEAFDRAVVEIAEASRKLLDAVGAGVERERVPSV